MAAALAPPGAEAALMAELSEASSPGDTALLLSGLAGLPGEEPRVALIPYLQDEDPLVRLQAARAIARVPAEEALLGLQSRLEDEKDPRVRRELTLAVGALGSAREIAELRTCLGRPLPRLERALCLDALAANPADEATRALVGIYNNKSSDLRREAATALGARPDPLSRTTLLSGAEKEEDPSVFRFVAAALGRLGETRARTRLLIGLEDPNVALFCAVALSDLGDADGAGVLRIGLQDREYRSTCLRALTKLKDADAEPAILKLYGSEDRLEVKALVLEYLLSLP
jgi:HEAT repeat protein